MKKLNGLVLIIAFFVYSSLDAKEGMWIPMLIDQLNIEDLKENGFKLTAEDIYSINKPSLKDAIVLFGGGCTGELISNEGLVLTNHHCGFGSIQKHSSLENNYLRNGFWAKSKQEELPNSGLKVKFLVEIIDFTDSVLSGIDKSLAYYKQKPFIDKRIEELEAAIEDTSKYKASVEKFYVGSEYYLFLYKEYTDVRLVGAPPMSIGNFGGDPDNWVWPRHTGDFSLFRIYGDANGEPADYSEENIPLKPKKSLKINASGVSENDFTMVMGYPARTSEYLYSRQLELLNDDLYPARIATRDGRLEIIDRAMSKDEMVYIQYATKQKRISNAWKKWKGVIYGFGRFNVIEKRKAYELELLGKAGAKRDELKELYGLFDDTYIGLKPYLLSRDMFFESVNPIEPFLLLKKTKNTLISGKESEKFTKALSNASTYFKDYNVTIDKQLTEFMLWNFLSNVGEEFHPASLIEFKDRDKLSEYLDKIYSKSVYTDLDRFKSAVKKAQGGNFKSFQKDPFEEMMTEFSVIYSELIAENYEYYFNQLDNLNQEYITIIREIETEKPIYPDANFTMRISYGKVEGYSPGDGIEYGYQSFLDGIMQKEAIGHEDYEVSPRLKELYEQKDYGKYQDENGKMPVCFIASNHTSGGNSGSPVLDAEGRLIGLNFDRSWEGTMSDFHFDEEICRNISVDIRYVLFVIDKYAGAGYLIDEMDIVWE